MRRSLVPSRSLRPYLVVVLVMPLVSSTLGIDGGAVFQIVAVEELGLSARAVGIAFGLGVLSVPVQVYAARMPLWRARSNLGTFYVLGAGGCLALAAVVATAGRGSPAAWVALALTVGAEITLSVLYATSWQPLLSYGLAAEDRQQVNSRGRAAGGAILAAALVVFGLLPTGGRVLFMVLVAGGALGLVLAVRRFAAPERPVRHATAEDEPPLGRPPLPAGVVPIYVALGVGAFATWPLFLIYSREVLWPSANLGLLGALQLAGTLGAAFAWRPTSGLTLVRRARLGAAALALASAAMLLFPTPVGTPVGAAPVVVLLVVAAVSTTTTLLALVELAHVKVSEETSVRTLTLLDVVTSTSFQVGLVAGGLLVDASAGSPGGLDPYRLYLVATSLGLVASLLRVHGDPPA